jgi:hypothetical protein
MYQHIDHCDQLGIPIYHIHTDSLLVPSDRVADLPADALSTDAKELGRLKKEYECSSADIVFSGRYTLVCNDQVVKKGYRLNI